MGKASLLEQDEDFPEKGRRSKSFEAEVFPYLSDDKMSLG